MKRREQGTPCRLGTSAVTLAICLLGLLPRAAQACATCYGDPNDPMTQGANMGVLVMLGFVGMVWVGFGKFIWGIYRRQRRLEGRRLRLIQGGKN